MPEGDDVVIKRVHDIPSPGRELVVEIDSSQFHREGIGVILGALGVELRDHGESGDLRRKENHLPNIAQEIADEGLGAVQVRRPLDDSHAGRDNRSERRIGEVHWLTAGNGRKAKEVDDHADAILAAIDCLRHAEAPLRNRSHVASGVQQKTPTFVPSVSLEHHLDGKVGRAAA